MHHPRALCAIVCGLTATLLGCAPASDESQSLEIEAVGTNERSDELPDGLGELRILTAASSRALPGVSGLAHHRGALYLAVHDTKLGHDAPRVAVVRVDQQASPEYRALTLDWESFGGPSHDLESITSIPGRPGEYLVSESGKRGLDQPRILHLIVSGSRLAEVEARLLGFFKLPADVKSIEGIAIVPRKGQAMQLGLCERSERKGDSTRGREKERYAYIRWSELDFGRYTLQPRFASRLRAERWPGGKGLRTCSEIYFDVPTEQLWLSATIDDEGERYDSMLYRMRFDSAMLGADGEWQLTPWASVPGYKLEAIATPLRPGWGPTLGSDGDLEQGLIWPVEPN
jgi:hypothetical protein